MKNIYLIIGRSGSGKTTLTEMLAKEHGLKTVWSYTTRPARYEGEEGHIFVSEDEFDCLGEMCAYTEYGGYRYGVTSEIIDNSDLYVIDPPGVLYLKDRYKGSKGLITVFLDISRDICRQRMEARGDNPEVVQKRLDMDEGWFDSSKFGFSIDLTIRDGYWPEGCTLKPWSPETLSRYIWENICYHEGIRE